MLGQTFASMFPERVGRLVLDGVVDPNIVITGLEINDITFTDDVFSTFFLYCSLAGPPNCAFATGSTPHDVYLRFENIISRLNASYAIEQGWSNATAIDAALIGLKSFAFSFNYKPIVYFPLVAELLVQLEAILPNLTLSALENLQESAGASSGAVTVDSLWERAIRCSDTNGVLFNKTIEDLLPFIESVENKSYIAGEEWSALGLECTGWKITSDYHFSGKSLRTFADIQLLIFQ